MKITTGKDLGEMIDSVIKNAIAEAPARGLKASLYHKSLEEKDKQDSIFNDDEGKNDEKEEKPNIFDDEKDSSSDEEKSDDGVQDDDDEKLKDGDISVDDIVEKLNTIRSGKSFKDSAIKGKLEAYINDLDDAEKTALFAFLKGVAQITTGEVDSDDAVVPDKPAPDVHMKKGNKQSKHVEPNVIKGAPEKKKVQKHGQEDDSGPTPITPKKK